MFSTINKYSSFTTTVLKEKYTYRFKAIMWSLSTVFNMLIQYFLWSSIYDEINMDFLNVSKQSYLAYISFGVVFYSLTSCIENMNIAEDIKTGNIAMNLIKPFNYKNMVLFRHLGSKAGDFIGLIPLIIIATILAKDFTVDAITLLLTLISTVLAFFIVFNFSYIVGLLTFWTINYWGIQFFVNALMGLFSGQLMAIHFYNEIGRGVDIFNSTLPFLHTKAFMMFFKVLGVLAYSLPFQSMYYTPMSILSGIISKPNEILYHILLQVFWLVALNLIGNIMWKAAQKKITILGG